jgi:hypothetical protein
MPGIGRASPVDHHRGGPAGPGAGGDLVTLTLRSVLILIAVVLFIVAAIGVDTNINLLALGLAFFAGGFVVPDRNLSNRM